MADISQTDIIRRLISQHTTKREELRVQLQKFESGEYHIGTKEIGFEGGDISQQWAQKLKEWIAELDRILTDLDGLLQVTRRSI